MGVELQAVLRGSGVYRHATGHAVLDLHRGVPLCKAGQPVRVRIRTLTGTLVVSGAFMPHHDD